MIGFMCRICLLMLAASAFAQPQLPPLPPVTSPASHLHLPGKFIWADLFSSDISASIRFYEGLFGWEFRWISQPPQPYGVFSLNGTDIAGIAYRSVEDSHVYARWVHYVSVTDVGKAEAAMESQGGQTLVRATVADRGEFAIFSSPTSALLGVIRSSSGDPQDYRAEVGEWIWRQLYVHDLNATVAVLRRLTDFEIETASDNDEVDRLLLGDGYLRAGLARLPADSKAGPAWIGFIRVSDVGATLARLIALGGTAQYTSDNQDMAIISDPQGALIGLWNYEFPEENSESGENAQ